MTKKTKEIEKKHKLINGQIDIVPFELTIWLNENFEKKSGKKFSNRDIYSYVLRKRLPKRYGGNEIQIVKDIKYSKIIRILD